MTKGDTVLGWHGGFSQAVVCDSATRIPDNMCRMYEMWHIGQQNKYFCAGSVASTIPTITKAFMVDIQAASKQQGKDSLGDVLFDGKDDLIGVIRVRVHTDSFCSCACDHLPWPGAKLHTPRHLDRDRWVVGEA